MAKLFANSGDPDQTLHSVVSDLGLHCLPVTLLWVSRLQWVNSADNILSEHLLKNQLKNNNKKKVPPAELLQFFFLTQMS